MTTIERPRCSFILLRGMKSKRMRMTETLFSARTLRGACPLLRGLLARESSQGRRTMIIAAHPQGKYIHVQVGLRAKVYQVAFAQRWSVPCWEEPKKTRMVGEI